LYRNACQRNSTADDTTISTPVVSQGEVDLVLVVVTMPTVFAGNEIAAVDDAATALLHEVTVSPTAAIVDVFR